MDDAHLRGPFDRRELSNELYRSNLAKGQTGLSVAVFDLQLQTGYDAGDELARGEVGKVGVPVAHRGDMAALLNGIPLDKMNTSMTINAHGGLAAGALRRRRPRRTACDPATLAGHDPERHHQGVPGPRHLRRSRPSPSMRLIADMVGLHRRARPDAGTRSTSAPTTCRRRGPRRCRRSPTRWPTPSRFSTRVRERVPTRRSMRDGLRAHLASSSTPACASSRSTPSCARWACCGTELGRERYGVQDPKQLRFRYGVQVNSLGLTESQPENNVQRIVLEALGGHARPRRARHGRSSCRRGTRRSDCRARGTSSGRCASSRCWRYETDLLEYPDLFEGSRGDRRPRWPSCWSGARAEMAIARASTGARSKRGRLHEVGAGRVPCASASGAIEAGEQIRSSA